MDLWRLHWQTNHLGIFDDTGYMMTRSKKKEYWDGDVLNTWCLNDDQRQKAPATYAHLGDVVVHMLPR